MSGPPGGAPRAAPGQSVNLYAIQCATHRMKAWALGGPALLLGAAVLAPLGLPQEPDGARGALSNLELTGGEVADCPASSECFAFRVQCPGLGNRTGVLSLREAADPVGLVLLHNGGKGTAYWAKTNQSQDALADLQAANLTTVQIKWNAAWLRSGSTAAGPIVLSCRPATVITWVFHNWYAPLNLTANGTCGFCYTGNSAGAIAGAYAMTRYGAGELLDAAIFTSGPPIADVASACIRTAGSEHLLLPRRGQRHTDHLYGVPRNGPCLTDDASWMPRWQNDSLDAPGGQWNLSTEAYFLFGSRDNTAYVAQGEFFADVLAGNQTSVEVLHVEGAGHTIQRHEGAVQQIVEWLTS